MQRYYAGDNIVNCRDIGGYACRGGITKYGVALRAGVFKDPSEKDLEILRNFGIRTVIDLRGDGEAADMPSFFENNPEFDYHHISLLEANPAMVMSNASMTDIYEECLNGYSANVARVLKIIASLDEPFMFHCFCGKDRTGMVAALLLIAAGVCKEDIIADYEVSYTYTKPYVAREIRNKSGIIWEGSYERFYSHGENMEHILNYIEEKFGGVEGYFSAIGLTREETERLKNKLI